MNDLFLPIRLISLAFGFMLCGTVDGRAQLPAQEAVAALVGDQSLAGAEWSISLIDIERNELLADYQGQRLLTPASSLKVLTTSTALLVLGPDYRFRTELAYDGYIDAGGTLQGHLYLKGYGDPTLGSDQYPGVPGVDELLQGMFRALNEAGIKRIAGGVIGDATYFTGPPAPYSWPDRDAGNYYGAGVWALNIHENLFYLPFQQAASEGAKPRLLPTRPSVAGLELDNQVTSAGRNSGDNAYIYGRPYEYRRVVRGTIPAGGGTFTIKGSVPDAPLLAAQLLTDYLRRHGIGVDQSASTYVPDPSRDFSRTPLLTLLSPTVQEIVQRANQKSVNLYCEALLLAIGKKYRDEGSRSAGIEAIKAVWSERGLDLSEAKLLDGSGLSWGNRLSGYQLATLLRKIDRDPTISGIFRESLAVAGRSGTLQDAMRGTLAEGRITAKTGSMKKVRSYSGFAETRSGQQLAFSIIVNNYPCSSWQIRRKLEELMAAFCR